MGDVAAAYRSLTAACQARGLSAVFSSHPPSLRVRVLGGDDLLGEVVWCRPGEDGKLAFYVSWGEPLAAAGEPERAAEQLYRMVQDDW